MVIIAYLSTITLNVNKLNPSLKRYSLATGEKKYKQTKKIHLNAAYQKLTSELQTHTDFKGMDKSISCK